VGSGRGEGKWRVSGARKVRGRRRWYRDIDLAFQVPGHDEARGFREDFRAGVRVEPQHPHPVVTSSELLLRN
jgi:hypothetical protein